MKQLITKLLMLAAALSAGTNVYAFQEYDFEVDGIYYNIISSTEKTVEVTYETRSYEGGYGYLYNSDYSGNIVIPEQVIYNNDTYSIASIGESAFCDCTGLTSVTIPNSVISIGYSAFRDCTGLTSVTIPNSITSIGSFAFDNCIGLKSVYISDLSAWCKISFLGMYSNPLCYAHNLYLNGDLLTDLTIPDDITEIKAYAFYGSNLISVTIPNRVTTIGESAFMFCSNVKELVIEDGEKILELGDNGYDGLFYDCPLETVYLGRNLNYDSSYDSGYSPFYETSITTLTIGNTVTSIGSYAFDGCNGLTFVTMGNSVTSIGYEAFNNCSKLTSVTIPNSVISISGRAFSNCTGLESVNISDLSAWCKISFSGEDSNPVYYAHNLYLNGELFTDLTIPDDITEINSFAFIGCRGLTSVTTPNNVTAIGGSAFKNCSDLASITIPNSVTKIGGSAFRGCNLNHISFEYNKDIDVGTLAEDNPNAIADIYVPNDVIWFSNANPYSNFNYNLYFDNDLVTEYTFPKDALEIQSNVFKGCISIKDITVPDNIIIIGSAAFKDSGLESLILGKKVTKIEGDAFNCNNLMKISSLNTYYPIIKVSSFSDYSYQNAMVNVPMESLKDYKESEWGNFQNLNGKTFGNIEYITRGEVKVTISGGNIIVDGADDFLKRVYNLSGQLVYSGIGTTIPISTSGIYLINIADKTYKITIK